MELLYLILGLLLILIIVIVLILLVSGRPSDLSLKSSKKTGEKEVSDGEIRDPRKSAAFRVHKQKGFDLGIKHYTDDEALSKKLRCAGWNMMPVTYRALRLAAACSGALLFFVFGFGLKILWLPFGFATGALVVSSCLNRAIQKRFKNFDNDYPNFLLSLCGLLRTGMNPLHASEVSVENLGDQSLLKLEVLLMIERLRFGVSEDIAIGTFGETIDHPEIELFVQALLLSRRLGGTLSDSLERLAKQVRKRQFFRSSALAAVSMQRGSVWAIVFILVGLLAYIFVVYPPLITEGFSIFFGQVIWQIGVIMMMTGIWWVRQVTNFKI